MNMLDRHNEHLFLEKQDLNKNSFIANVNKTAASIDIIKKFNEYIEDVEAILENISNSGNYWVVKLQEVANNLIASKSAFNFATLVTIPEDIASGAEIELPDLAQYIVGTHMLMVSYNGTICYIGEQYEEIGEIGKTSKKIRMLFDLRANDKIMFRVIALNSELELNTILDKLSVRAEGSTEYRTLSNRFADIVNVKDFGAKGNAECVEVVTETVVKKPLVVIVAGQSNAVGAAEDTATHAISVNESAYWDRSAWVSPLRDPVTPAPDGGWVPAFAQRISSMCNRPVYVVNVAIGGANCANGYQSSGGSWGSAWTLRTRAEHIVSEALAAMTTKYDVLGTIWIQGESDVRNIKDGRETLEDYTASVSEIAVWAQQKFGGSFFISKLSYQGSTAYDTQTDIVNGVLQSLVTTVQNCYIASNRAVTFRAEGYLRDEYHYTQDGYDILGRDLANYCISFVQPNAVTVQKDIVVEYRGVDDTDAFEAAAATGKSVFVPVGNYVLSRYVSGHFFCLGNVGINTQYLSIVDLLTQHPELSGDAVELSSTMSGLGAEISAANYALEDIYKQRIQDGTNTRMINVRLDAAKDAQYNQPGFFEGVYSKDNLMSNPELDPLHIDDPVLVGTPWGMSKKRYLPKLRCVINAQRIYGAYNKENPANTGFGYWYSPDTKAKWQGNTTIATGKKSITLKLSEAIDINGWGPRKKFVIKNNIPNSPHSNLLLARLWGDVVRTPFTMRDANIVTKLQKLTNCGAIDGLPCTYSVNGQYYGLGSLNTPKDENLFDIAGDSVSFVLGAGSNNRQLYVMMKNLALDAFNNNRIDTLIDEVIGKYEDFSGLMGTLRRWTPSAQAVFPVFASQIKKQLAAIPDTESIQINVVISAVQKAIDNSVEHYKKLFKSGTDRDSTNVSKTYMWTVFNSRCQSAVWLRDLIMSNMTGISYGFLWAVKLTRERLPVTSAPYSEKEPVLFQEIMQQLDDGFEEEYIAENVSPLSIVNGMIELVVAKAPLNDLSAVFDVGSAIDMMIFTLLSQDIDAIKNNFLLVSYGGKVFMSPYDMNQSFIIADAAFANPSNNLAVTLETLRQSALYAYLLDNEETKSAIKSRFSALRQGPLSDWAVAARLANITKYIAPQAYTAEETRWPMYGYFNEAWTANAILDRYRMQANKVTEIINAI